jgi:hypothetical protein
MTALRQRMLDEMRLVGLAASTQKIYIREVRELAAHYRRCPSALSQEEVRQYLLAVHGRGVARGTFKTCVAGLQFLYCQTLHLDWPLFTKKKIRLPKQKRLRRRARMPWFGGFWPRSGTPFTAAAFS